jgi:AcrR family transcriptional regulator
MTERKKRAATKEKVLENLREGMTREAAATQAGISKATLYRWIDDDDDFRDDVEAAVDFAEAVMVSQIKTMGHSRDDWRAIAWLLERRFPDRWGLKREVEVAVSQRSDGIAEVKAMIEQTTPLVIQAQRAQELDEEEDDE